jgi:hypothetical protein
MENKLTAVEWIVEQLTPSISLQQKHIDELFKQAKEMEKERMIKFANDFLFHDDTDLTAEQYYNETFNK